MTGMVRGAGDNPVSVIRGAPATAGSPLAQTVQ
jgi:hypothetical protein